MKTYPAFAHNTDINSRKRTATISIVSKTPCGPVITAEQTVEFRADTHREIAAAVTHATNLAVIELAAQARTVACQCKITDPKHKH